MLSRLSHTTVYVLDHNRALAFYRDTLGLEVRTDATMDGGFRWLTVGPSEQPDLEIALMVPQPGPGMSEETCQKLRELVQAGAFGAGVFSTRDCQQTYESLKAKGVAFLSPPQPRPYGIEAIFKDDSGNWFSLTQPV